MNKRFILYTACIVLFLLTICIYTIWLPLDINNNVYYKAKLNITFTSDVDIRWCREILECNNYTNDDCIKSNNQYCKYGRCYNIYTCGNETYDYLNNGYCRPNKLYKPNVICNFLVTKKYNYIYYNDQYNMTIECKTDCPSSSSVLYYSDDDPSNFVTKQPKNKLSGGLITAMIVFTIITVGFLFATPIYFSLEYKTNQQELKIKICGDPIDFNFGWLSYLSLIGVWLFGLFSGAIIYWNDLSLILIFGTICCLGAVVSVVITAGIIAITSYISIYYKRKFDLWGLLIVSFSVVFSIALGIPLLTVYLSDPTNYSNKSYMFMDGIYFIICAAIFLISQIAGMWIGMIHAKKTYNNDNMLMETNIELEVTNNEIN